MSATDRIHVGNKITKPSPRTSPVARRRRRRFAAILIVLVFAGLEGICYLGVRYSRAAQRLFYLPQQADFDLYTRRRHPILGWATAPRMSKPGSPKTADPARFPDSGVLVSLYGDSWTYSPYIDDEHAYSAVLSRLLNAGVVNYGVPAYGTGQAYLRFKNNADDRAKIVILGHLSENLIRNLNQFRDLLYPDPSGSGAFFFSPRFVLGSHGTLQFVPPPDFSAPDYINCVRRPQACYLPCETFLPGGTFGPAEFSFPFTLSVVRPLVGPSPWRKWWTDEQEARWAEFYRPDHGAKGLQITVGIIRAFFDDAERRGKIPVLVIFPTQEDLKWYAQRKAWCYQSLTNELHSARIPHMNMGPFMQEANAAQAPGSLFQPNGHLNEEGCRIQALGVYRHLQERGLVPGSPNEREKGSASR